MDVTVLQQWLHVVLCVIPGSGHLSVPATHVWRGLGDRTFLKERQCGSVNLRWYSHMAITQIIMGILNRNCSISFNFAPFSFPHRLPFFFDHHKTIQWIFCEHMML